MVSDAELEPTGAIGNLIGLEDPSSRIEKAPVQAGPSRIGLTKQPTLNIQTPIKGKEPELWIP